MEKQKAPWGWVSGNSIAGEDTLVSIDDPRAVGVKTEKQRIHERYSPPKEKKGDADAEARAFPEPEPEYVLLAEVWQH